MVPLNNDEMISIHSMVPMCQGRKGETLPRVLRSSWGSQ